jgi:hypothetical protein
MTVMFTRFSSLSLPLSSRLSSRSVIAVDDAFVFAAAKTLCSR